MLPDADDINNSQIGNLIPLEENLNKTLGHESLNIKLDTHIHNQILFLAETLRSVIKIKTLIQVSVQNIWQS